ncbi:MAG: hypothetical protein H0X25_17210 [Acidobacteriales bacterium]|nr:hypothetical protein [Terriglobales bacterium]
MSLVQAQASRQNPPQTVPPAMSCSPTSGSADELQALQADVSRMRSLILQMQNNLAFVGSTTTPLRHQFELEISLWQLELDQMERHLAALQNSSKPR